MGDDLALLVLINADDLFRGGEVIPHTILEMGQYYGVLGQVIDLSWMRLGGRLDIPEQPHIATHPLPPGATVYIQHESGSEMRRLNPYGDELVWSSAGDLCELNVPDDGTPSNVRNKAVKAYLAELPADTPIIVYHH